MFVPEYSITSEILNNISAIEYGKAIIENTTILPHWRKQLKKEAKVKTIKHSLEMDGKIVNNETVKKYLSEIAQQTPQIIKNFNRLLDESDEAIESDDFDEDNFKHIHKTLTQNVLEDSEQGKYRSTKTVIATDPEQILAEIVKLFDWYNSLDAKQTHPILLAGIMHGQIKKIQPFVSHNFSASIITARICLRNNNYSIRKYLAYEEFFNKDKKMYEGALSSIVEDDFTSWLEYYTDAVARESSNQKEKIMLLAKDTKIAKASGKTRLTRRQEKIVTFLQDYGVMRNEDFDKLFPNISEDTVLRELKKLMQKEIIVKKGKTKASRYELA